MLDRRTLTIAGIGLAVILFVALNAWGSLTLRRERLDLTSDRQFTLSHGTIELLGQDRRADDAPVLRVARAARRQPVPRRPTPTGCTTCCSTYADAAHGKITVEYIDPEPFSVEEDRAVGFGLESVPLENKASTGYFGIAGTNSTDDVDVAAGAVARARERSSSTI